MHFINDQSQFARNITNEGDEVIIATNMNEHLMCGKVLAELRKVGIAEAIAKNFNSLEPVSYAKESKPIDGVWVTNDLVPKAVSILLANFGVGDYKIILIDSDFD